MNNNTNNAFAGFEFRPVGGADGTEYRVLLQSQWSPAELFALVGLSMSIPDSQRPFARSSGTLVWSNDSGDKITIYAVGDETLRVDDQEERWWHVGATSGTLVLEFCRAVEDALMAQRIAKESVAGAQTMLVSALQRMMRPAADQVMDALSQPKFVQQIAERMDHDAVADMVVQHLDLDSLSERIADNVLQDVTNGLDLTEIVDDICNRFDLEDVARAFDVCDIAENIDMRDLARNIDAEEVADNLDVRAVAEFVVLEMVQNDILHDAALRAASEVADGIKAELREELQAEMRAEMLAMMEARTLRARVRSAWVGLKARLRR